MCGLWVVVCG
jgi:hypothetical protein